MIIKLSYENVFALYLLPGLYRGIEFLDFYDGENEDLGL
jgi:hypothetical protein